MAAGFQCGGEMPQAIGDSRMLGLGEPGEPEAAPNHEVRVAPELALPPDHGAPDHLGREAQRPARRREIERAGSTEAEEVEVLDLRARRAKVKKADLTKATHPRGWPLNQPRAWHCSPLRCLAHRSLTSTIANNLPQNPPSRTDIGAAGPSNSVSSVAPTVRMRVTLTRPPPPSRCAPRTPRRTRGPPRADGPSATGEPLPHSARICASQWTT